MDAPSVRFTTSLTEAALIDEALENLQAVTKAQYAASSSPRQRSELTAKTTRIVELRKHFTGSRRG